MKISRIGLLLTAFLLFTGSSLMAQEEDFNLWAEIGLETHLSKRFDVVVGLSNRWYENASRRDVSLAEMSLEYGKKWFSSGIGYRFENKSDPERSYILGHRFFAFAKAETKAGRFTMELRNKFQSQYFSVKSSEDGLISSDHDRTRFKVDYNVKKIPLKPYLAFELFSPINHYDKSPFDKNRIATGLSYKFNAKNKLDVSFYFDREVAVAHPDKDYILSASWAVELN